MKDEIIAILDRSTSMTGFEKATMEGFNAFIKDQRSISEDCAVTLMLFDSKYETIYEAKPINEVELLTEEVYFTQGMTALRDAVGAATKNAGARFSKAAVKPNKVIVYINTDGQENDSHEVTAKQLKEIIKHQEEKYGWEYIYAGCDHDVFAVARDLGIKVGNTINYSKSKLRSSHAFASTVTASYRS